MYDYELDSNGGMYNDPSWNPIENSPQPQEGGAGKGYLTYDFLGWDGPETDVYRGSDGNLYMGASGPGSMSGFAPYTGSGTNLTPNPGPRATTPPPAATGGGGAATGGGGPSAGLGGLLAPYTGTYTAPGPGAVDISYIGAAPQFQAPVYKPPPAFAAPTEDEALNEPGYKFGLDESLRALEQSRAAAGIRLTGGTLKDIVNYGRNAARQQYTDVYGRNLKTYETNYGTQYADPYRNAYQAAMDSFAPKMAEWSTRAQASQRANELNQQTAWDQFMFDYNKFRDQRDSTWNKNYQYATT